MAHLSAHVVAGLQGAKAVVVGKAPGHQQPRGAMASSISAPSPAEPLDLPVRRLHHHRGLAGGHADRTAAGPLLGLAHRPDADGHMDILRHRGSWAL